ncbi:MAG: ABC transporter ATP-binding protein [Actinomycetota bacterium]
MTVATSSPGSAQREIAGRAVEAVKIYGTGQTEVRALDHATVDFEAERFTAIMGPSGSGKSTLLHCLAGLDRLTSGQIFLGDVEVSALDEKRLTLLRREKIGFVFQFFNLLPTLTALENITLPLSLAGRRPDAAWFDQVVESLQLGDRLGHRPSEMSGGQQQRVAVARALASRPQIVFADEPTGNLDSRAGGQMLELMQKVVEDLGQTILMVTHDAAAAAYSDRVLFLQDGKPVAELEDPTSDAVIEHLKHLGG